MMKPAYPFRLGQEEGRVSCFYPSNNLFFVGISGLMVELKKKCLLISRKLPLKSRRCLFVGV